jgi:integrase
MATIKYLLQSKSETAPIYLRLSLGRANTFKRKTGLVFNPKEWSLTTGYPKTKDAQSKRIKSDLKNLEAHVIDKYNLDNSNGVTIDGFWLENVIKTFHNRMEPESLDYLVSYGEHFIEKLPYRVTANGNRGVNKDTLVKYNTIVKKLKGFEEHTKKKILIKDVNLNFRHEFIKYLTDEEKIGDNTAGRYISFVKTIVLDARKSGKSINPQINDFKGFTVKPPKIILTIEDIEKIKKAKILKDKLIIARDWLIIGCYTGQRVSDLLRMNKKMIEKNSGFNFIVLEQVKTKVTVQIPIHSEVQTILDKRKGNFPPVFAKTNDSNSAIFNLLIKDVCKIAELNEEIKGNLYNHETKRTELGLFPKWKLVSSHICRRSFASNFYSQRQYPTPLLMSVTGHKTETMFLEYIGKKPLDYAIQLAQIWANESKKPESKKPKLTVLRATSN